MNEIKKTSWFKKSVVGTAIISMLGVGYSMCGNDGKAPGFIPKHDNDTLLMFLKNGKTLQDVELLYDKDDDIEFDGVFKLSKDLPNTYVVDPAKDDDSRITEIIKLLKKDSDVETAEYNQIMSIPANEKVVASSTESQTGKFPNDPLYQQGKMWGQTAIHAEAVHDLLMNFKPKRPAKVWVLDTGIIQHEDLEAKLYTKDGHGHGTHCAGTIGALTNNGKGVSSLSLNNKFIELYSIKVLSDWGSGSTAGIAKAIIEAANKGADVISMSLGGPGKSTVLEKACKYAMSKGTIIVAAAGNENGNADNSAPANVPGVITVGAVGQYGKKVKRAPFSNYGDIVDVSAPGMVIWSTVPKNNRMSRGNLYIAIQGTSMATPHVAGLVGLTIAVNPNLRGKRDDITRILKESGSDPVTEKDKPIGKFINGYGAIKAAINYK